MVGGKKERKKERKIIFVISSLSSDPIVFNKMYLREARLSDMPTVGGLAARAFIDDPLFTIVEPKRHAYYEDYEASWIRRIRRKFLRLEARVILAVDEESNDITGFAVWMREGDDPAADRWRDEGGMLKRMITILREKGYLSILFYPPTIR